MEHLKDIILVVFGLGVLGFVIWNAVQETSYN